MMLFETTPIVSHDITVGWAKAHSWIPNLKFALTTDNQVEILIDNHAAWQRRCDQKGWSRSLERSNPDESCDVQGSLSRRANE